MQITTITPEQAARIPEWVQQWIDIGLSTEPADFDRATAAALSRPMGGGRGIPR